MASAKAAVVLAHRCLTPPPWYNARFPFARDPTHEMHAHFQLAICTAFAPIVVKDPLLKTNLMLGSVSYFTYALAVFGDGMWDNDPWKPVLQLNFLYENIVNAIIDVLE